MAPPGFLHTAIIQKSSSVHAGKGLGSKSVMILKEKEIKC